MTASSGTANPLLVLVRLKLLLLRNGFRRSTWQLVAFVLAALWALSLVVPLVALLVTLRAVDLGAVAPVVVGAGSLVVLGWAVVPLVAFGVDETTDPARLATFGVPRHHLVPGLLLAGAVGLPGVATLVLALATVVTFSRSVAAVPVALLGALLLTATAVAASRATTTVAAGLLRARRTRDVVVVVLGAAAVGAGPGVNVVASRAGDLSGLAASAAAVAGWTPFGFAIAASADAAAGVWGTALVRLLLAVLTLAAVLLVWALALGPGGTGPTGGRGSSGRVVDRTGGVLDRLPATPAGAVARRCLTYWHRDPRYLVSGVSLVVLPAVLLVLPLAQGAAVGPWLVVAAPAAAFVGGWSLHDDVAYDHSAFALHVAAGVRGRDDRWGRVLAALVWQVPLLLLLAVAGGVAAGRLDLLPAVLGVSAALLGSGLGVSSVASALTPYPAPAPGANPFQSPKGAALATVLAQLATSTVSFALALPVLALAVAAYAWQPWVGWCALLLGLGLGVLWVRLGVVRGGAVLDRRAPEVLATVSSS